MRWEELGGGVRTKKILQGILRSARVANAYLFVGFGLEGKLNCARVFSQGLLCRQKEDRPCNRCEACLKFEKGVHPDFILLEPEGQTLKIEQIRELKSRLHYGPSRGEYLVVLIKGADALTVEAANSFLKNLEEPVEGVVFLLLASSEENLPLTIASRCQRVVFEEELLSGEETQDFLSQLEGVLASEVIGRLDLAQGLLKSDPDVKQLLLNLLALHQKRVFLALEDRRELRKRLNKVRLLLDAYRKIGLHVNQRLVLETLCLKWGAENETASH